MSKRPTVGPEAEAEPHVARGGRTPVVPVDTNFRPQATSVPDLALIARIYLDSLRNGRRPIESRMERFNVDRNSAKGWPTLCRAAGLLPDRDQPQIAAPADDNDSSYRFRVAG